MKKRTFSCRRFVKSLLRRIFFASWKARRVNKNVWSQKRWKDKKNISSNGQQNFPETDSREKKSPWPNSALSWLLINNLFFAAHWLCVCRQDVNKFRVLSMLTFRDHVHETANDEESFWFRFMFAISRRHLRASRSLMTFTSPLIPRRLSWDNHLTACVRRQSVIPSRKTNLGNKPARVARNFRA